MPHTSTAPSIVDVIKERIDLRPFRDKFVGNCPWCLTMNLIVNPEREIYHCVFCGSAGNAGDFLLHMRSEMR
jgi:DNA primase